MKVCTLPKQMFSQFHKLPNTEHLFPWLPEEVAYRQQPINAYGLLLHLTDCSVVGIHNTWSPVASKLTKQ